MSIRDLFIESINDPWAILPTAMSAILSAIEEPEQSAAGYLPSLPEAMVKSDSTAIIPIHGTIVRRANRYLPSAEGVSREIRSAMADDSVKSILLDIDSPGGVASGIQETADLIRSSRERKPIVALANNLAASAAYWIAASASEVVAAPSGDVGSVGVFALHGDESGFLEKMGVKVTMVTSAKYKAEFSPFGPLNDEARAELQRRVNETHADFVQAVASGRATTVSNVNKTFGEGRVVRAKDAVQRGMADRIGTLESTLERLSGPGRFRVNKRRADEFTAKEVEEILKAGGMSANLAKYVVARGFQELGSREETDSAEAGSREETAAVSEVTDEQVLIEAILNAFK